MHLFARPVKAKPRVAPHKVVQALSRDMLNSTGWKIE
jgi:hypothetical protein